VIGGHRVRASGLADREVQPRGNTFSEPWNGAVEGCAEAWRRANGPGQPGVEDEKVTRLILRGSPGGW